MENLELVRSGQRDPDDEEVEAPVARSLDADLRVGDVEGDVEAPPPKHSGELVSQAVVGLDQAHASPRHDPSRFPGVGWCWPAATGAAVAGTCGPPPLGQIMATACGYPLVPTPNPWQWRCSVHGRTRRRRGASTAGRRSQCRPHRAGGVIDAMTPRTASTSAAIRATSTSLEVNRSWPRTRQPTKTSTRSP